MRKINVQYQFNHDGFHFIIFDNNTFLTFYDNCEIDYDSLEEQAQICNILTDAIDEQNSKIAAMRKILNTIESNIADRLGMQYRLSYSIPESNDSDSHPDKRYTYNHCENCDELSSTINVKTNKFICHRCLAGQTHDGLTHGI